MSEMLQKPTASIELKRDEIRIIKQEDGNWKGYMLRNQDLLVVREVDPYTCLMKLLTHP
jgi:hypothetical protein